MSSVAWPSRIKAFRFCVGLKSNRTEMRAEFLLPCRPFVSYIRPLPGPFYLSPVTWKDGPACQLAVLVDLSTRTFALLSGTIDDVIHARQVLLVFVWPGSAVLLFHLHESSEEIDHIIHHVGRHWFLSLLFARVSSFQPPYTILWILDGYRSSADLTELLNSLIRCRQ